MLIGRQRAGVRFQEAAEHIRTAGMAQLVQRFRLNLADTFAGHAKLLAR
jgi:hypothetical protein